MSTEQNRNVVLGAFEKGINGRDLGYFDNALDSSYVNRSMPAPGPGPEGFKQMIGMFFEAFPDMTVTVEQSLADGDLVSTRGVMRGTQNGAFMGIPPTGRKIEIPYIDIWRFADGKAVENWVQMDMLGMMQQLGVIPAPADHQA